MRPWPVCWGVGGQCREGTSWADPRSPHHIDGTPGPAGKILKQLQSAEALEVVGAQHASFPRVPFPPPTHFSDHSSLARHPSLTTLLSQWVSMPLDVALTARESREPLSLVTILAPRAPLLLQPGVSPRTSGFVTHLPQRLPPSSRPSVWVTQFQAARTSSLTISS